MQHSGMHSYDGNDPESCDHLNTPLPSFLQYSGMQGYEAHYPVSADILKTQLSSLCNIHVCADMMETIQRAVII